MKTATVKELKNELSHYTQNELIDMCLSLSKFKKENKELLTYLLFEKENEDRFITGVKEEVIYEFTTINTASYFFIKKSVRRILRLIKKYIRYSKNKETEIELLLFFCEKLKRFQPSIYNYSVLENIYNRELLSIKKKLKLLHEDLQYDYNLRIENI